MKEFKNSNAPHTTVKTIQFPNKVIADIEKSIVRKNRTFSTFVIEAVKAALEDLKN